MSILSRILCFRIWAALLVIAVALLWANDAAPARQDGGFDVPGREVRAGRAVLTAKWEQALARHRQSLAEAACGETGRGCEVSDWRRFLAGLVDRPMGEQLARVNRYMNGFRYVTDRRNWGRDDYWAAPQELFRRGGDCEDYVIAKYLSLRALGVPAAAMRVVVLHDLGRDQPHAVLVVLGDGEAHVLDNLYRRVMTWRDLRRNYVPLYSLNEDTAWVHVRPRG